MMGGVCPSVRLSVCIAYLDQLENMKHRKPKIDRLEAHHTGQKVIRPINGRCHRQCTMQVGGNYRDAKVKVKVKVKTYSTR